MSNRYHKNAKGVTLVETVAAVAVIVMAVTGGMGFRYYSALHARRADVKITASRLGLLLLENWKGTGGAPNYDPVAQFSPGLTISTNNLSTGTIAGAADFSTLGNYHIEANGTHYYVTLAYKEATGTEPRTLSMRIAWLRNYQAGNVSNTDQSVMLTTYAGY